MMIWIASFLIAAGCVAGAMVVARDMRRLRAARTQLAEQNALLRATLDNIDQGIVVVDRDLRMRAWNHRFLELNNCPAELAYRDAPYADVLRHLVAHNTYSAQEPVADIVARIRSGVPHRIERRRPNSVIVEISGNYSPDGLMVTTFSDITARKNIERRKTEFITTVSHELRTPLTSIIGSLALLTSSGAGPLPEIANRLVTIAHTNAERLVRLVNDILDLEKIESGRIDFNTERIRLRSLVLNCIEANRAYGDRFNVHYMLGSCGDDGFVLVDPDRLTQVVTNLLSNAAKFSHPGGTVEVNIARRGNALRLSILDHGIGIPPAFRGHIFERFAQADRTKDRGVASTGLGLAICREIVERLGGQISFDSVYGEWTVFHVDLPLHREGTADTAPRPSIDDHSDGGFKADTSAHREAR